MKYIILLLLVLFLVGCNVVEEECPSCTEVNSETCSEFCDVCEECDNDKAMMAGYFISWGENLDNSEEVIFSMSVINYGFTEAKDVELTCYIESSTGRKIYETTKKVGNIASTSIAYKEIIVAPNKVVSMNSYGGCYISNCTDCILLSDRIPEIVEGR